MLCFSGRRWRILETLRFPCLSMATLNCTSWINLDWETTIVSSSTKLRILHQVCCYVRLFCLFCKILNSYAESYTENVVMSCYSVYIPSKVRIKMLIFHLSSKTCCWEKVLFLLKLSGRGEMPNIFIFFCVGSLKALNFFKKW